MTLRGLRAHLDRELFPPPPEEESKGGRGEELIVVLGVLVLGVVLQLLRLGWSDSLNSLWAEDGPIFLQGALTQDLGEALVDPYAGYLVVVPRLIGEGAALVPLPDAAAAVSILSAGVAALSGIAVWYASAAHIRNPYLRGTLAGLTMLVPVAGLESMDSAAYVPWYMLFATFWLLLWRPATTAAVLMAALFVLATGLSSPGVWFFAPLAALRAVAIRDWRDATIVGAFGLGAAAQVPVLLLNQEEAVEPLWTGEIWTAYAQRVVDGAAFGERLGGAAWAHLGWPFLGLLLLCAVVALAVGLWRSGPTGRWLAALAIPISLALFVVSAYQRAVGSQIVWPDSNYHGSAGRYAIVPALLLVSVALVMLDGQRRRDDRRLGLTWLGIGAIGLMALAIVTSFDVGDTVVRGTPPWDDALRSAATACVAEGTDDAPILTSPPGFGMSLPCDQVAEYADPAAAVAPPGRGP